jgi:hypothetical protein
MNINSQPNTNNEPNKNSLTPWLVGGGILAVISLVGVLVYKKRSKNIRKSK